MRLKNQLIVAALLSCVIAPRIAFAHKFHESLTQLEYNRQTQSVEISIRLFADDLEAALSKRTGRSVRLDKTPDVEPLTLDYLRHTFELKNGEGESKQLAWVGMEIQVDVVWAFVEVKMPEGMANAELRNRIFFELFRDQVNRVNIRDGEKSAALVFKPGDRFKSLMRSRDNRPSLK